MENLKRKTIELYIQSRLFVKIEKQEELFERLNEVSRIQWARKYQDLEIEGKAEEGRAWLSIDAMTHSYYYSKSCDRACGHQIWKKLELILFPDSLINGEYRNNNIQILEPGWVISIAYADMLRLRAEFIEIEKHIEYISMMNEKAYKNRLIILNESPMERVVKFEDQNPLFTTIATKEIKAMHLGFSRQGYNLLIKKLLTQK